MGDDRQKLLKELSERTQVPAGELARLEEGRLRDYFNHSADPVHAWMQIAASSPMIVMGAGLLFLGALAWGGGIGGAGAALGVAGFKKLYRNEKVIRDIHKELNLNP